MSKSFSGVRVVCFDLGGVIVRICRSWEEACARAGVDVRAACERDNTDDLLRMKADAVRAYQSGAMACDVYFETIARSTGDRYDAQEVCRIHKAWICDDYQGVEAMVLALREQSHVTTACLSNTNHSHWRILTQGEGADHPASATVNHIERHLVSHQLGFVKPDEVLYECAQETLGARAGEIVFFDDTRENIDAALRLGWRAFEIDHRGDTAAQMRGHLMDLGIRCE